jgi:hypothetical protein
VRTRMLSVILALTISGLPLSAQRIIIDGCGGDPPPPPPPPVTCPTSINSGSTAVNTTWGFYNWQVDMMPVTATLGVEFDFNSTPTGLVSIPVPASGNLPCAITVHEIHGTVVLEAQQGGSCRVNSMVAQVQDQNGNVLAAASLIQFGPSSANVPLKGTFSTPLSVSSFVLTVSVSPGCQSGLSWDLVMS